MKSVTSNLLARPAIAIALGLTLLVGNCSLIYYVQHELSEIEEALPITLSRQERDIRILVNNMGRLVQNIGFVRASGDLQGFDRVLDQTDEVMQNLAQVRANYRFNDLLGVSAIHAALNPAMHDIRSWLTRGIHNFEPRSAQTMALVQQRAAIAHEEAETLLLEVGDTAVDALSIQASRIHAFRYIMIITLAVLAVMTIAPSLSSLR